MWSDYLPASFVDSFTEKTGIKVNFTGIGSNEEILNKIKTTKGQGFDIVIADAQPRAAMGGTGRARSPGHEQGADRQGRTRPWPRRAGEIWNFGGKGTHWLPHIWGTEGIAWRTDKWQPEGEFPSYGDIWDDANAGKTMGRSPFADPVRGPVSRARAASSSRARCGPPTRARRRCGRSGRRSPSGASTRRGTSRSCGTTPIPRRTAS